VDVKDLLESLDYSKENIHRQALIYSFSNILTLSLLSEFGVKYNLSDEDIKNYIGKLNIKTDKNIMTNKELEISPPVDENHLKDDTKKLSTLSFDFSFVNNLSPIKAIYSGAKLNTSLDPEFKKDIDIGLDLNNKNFKKELKPKNQGLLILNEVNLSRFLYNNSVINRNKNSTYTEKLLGMILLDLAINQALFSYSYLRNSKGFFVKKENLIFDSNELKLKETNEKIDWEDQVYMLWAYAVLYKTLKDSNYERYFQSSKADIFKNYAFNLLNILESHEHEMIELDTANLSSLTSSMVEALHILDKKRKHKSFVISLCDELYTRQKQKGFILSNRYKNEAASLASHFKSIEALINGFQYTNFDLFLSASENIYSNLNTVWDENMGLFKLNKDDDIKYSSKSISYVLRSLNKLLKATNSAEMKKSINNQLTNFFDASINDTGLQTPPPGINKEINMFRKSNGEASIIQDIIDHEKAYVIEKGFKINKADLKINKYSNEFSCEHALFASDAMLTMAMEGNLIL
jgi:hypothetical protein